MKTYEFNCVLNGHVDSHAFPYQRLQQACISVRLEALLL